jgi:hypothetical protein
MLKLSAILLFLCSSLAEATMYRWVDAQGKVHYGDVMPTRQSGLGHQELDKQGRVVRETARTLLTPEERRRHTQEASEHEEHMRRVEEQQRRDRALLSTYANEQEIDLARDRALALEKIARDSLQSRMDASAAKLAFANGQLARYRAARSPEPANLLQMRDEAQVDLLQIGDALRQKDQILEELKRRFDADKERFQEMLKLRNISHD